MNDIIEKLCSADEINLPFRSWSWDERRRLLSLYLLISKQEHRIFDLIWRHHGCDSWEDIFRDYSQKWLDDKAKGIEVALEEVVRETTHSTKEKDNRK